MYFPDLSPYEYSWPGAYEESYCGLTVRNVGWLSGDHPFPTGDVPEELPARLLDLCAAQLLRNPLHCYGLHACEICPKSPPVAGADIPAGSKVYLGSDEIRVLSRDVVYAAPNLIYHYVTAHKYRPPDDFIAAVLNARAGHTRAYRMYAFRLWEAWLNPRGRHDFSYARASTGYLPGSRAGTTFGPLVGRYRLSQVAVFAGLILIFLVSKPVAGFLGVSWQVGLTAGALLGMSLLGVGVYCATHLPCPFCGAVLKPAPVPAKNDLQSQVYQRPPQWHDRFQFTEWLSCSSGHCLIQYRLSPFPWTAPPCHVWLQ